jgi:hypothetical protein
MKQARGKVLVEKLVVAEFVKSALFTVFMTAHH